MMAKLPRLQSSERPQLEVFSSLAEALSAGYEFYDEGSGGYLLRGDGDPAAFALVVRYVHAA